MIFTRKYSGWMYWDTNKDGKVWLPWLPVPRMFWVSNSVNLWRNYGPGFH